jgi:hypothetical protein
MFPELKAAVKRNASQIFVNSMKGNKAPYALHSTNSEVEKSAVIEMLVSVHHPFLFGSTPFDSKQ